MSLSNKFLKFAFVLFFLATGQRNLRDMPLDLSDPSLRDVYPLGVVTDVYVHFDIDPTVVQDSMVGGQQEIVDYLMSLTDVWNRDTYNPANFNLVVSSFSVNVKDTARDVMLNMQQNKVLREGEQHMWVHVTDYLASSIASRFGLYSGEDNSYAIVATFDGYGFTHGERTTGAHEIGHLFGLDHTHVLSLSYPNEVSVDIDYCGGGPNGKDCSTKPAIGGNVMSYCQECPGLADGGGFYSAKPLTSFHPFQAEKIQEHYHARENQLAKISWPKLRTFIPSQASGSRCAGEGGSCQCNGVVYFGPTITSDSPRIFAVTQSTSRVDCRAGASEAFPDVFHGYSKSCYCDQGATLTDVHYLPSTVEFTNVGTGSCEFTCPLSRSCSWKSVGYMTLSDQPEWKCKQECLDRTSCHGYNWKNNQCRLYQRPLTGASNSGQFTGSTCWSRPQGDGKYPDAQYTVRGDTTGPIIPVVDQWGPWDEWSECDATCGGGVRSRMRVCTGENCIGSNIESEECNLQPCVTPGECQYVSVDASECPNYSGSLPDCRSDIGDGDLCEADYPLNGVPEHNINNCPGGYDVFRYVCGGEVEEECDWVPLRASECPANAASFPDCHDSMGSGELCEADTPLPNGDSNYNIDNCGVYDMFRYHCSGSSDSPYWDSWTQWSDCSVDCGSGIQTRSRDCIGGECDGDSSETQQCTLEPCDDDTTTDSAFQDLGRGICRSSSGGVVGGWGGWPKSADECRRMCESRNSCIGYTAVTTGATGTCYVHGRFTENRPFGWFDANGNVYQIGKASGHYNLACYKRV